MSDEGNDKVGYGRLLERVDTLCEGQERIERLLQRELFPRLREIEDTQARYSGALKVMGGVWLFLQALIVAAIAYLR